MKEEGKEGKEKEEKIPCMYVRCAWCGKWLDVKEHHEGAISHGICDECLKNVNLFEDKRI